MNSATLAHGSSEVLTEDSGSPQELYLDLLKKCLTRYLFGEPYRPLGASKGIVRRSFRALIHAMLAISPYQLVRRGSFDPQARVEGTDWPAEAETMIGLKRLDQLQYCVTEVLRQEVPGDLIEAGVWRGGAAIFMRAILKAYGDTRRVVWVADSFEGVPKPNPALYPADANDPLWKLPLLGVPVEQVKANFARYGLLDHQVRFLVGWFRDTMPAAPIKQLAVLRVDGDLYESTMDVLQNLYAKVSVGGFVIVDDYWAMMNCKEAVDQFRITHGINDTLERVGPSVFWRRTH